MTIGERIKRRRNELHLSQRDLSNMMGYSNHSTIGKIETGKVDIPQSRIVQFANVLGVSIAYLMGWEDDQDKSDLIEQNEEKPLTPEEQEREAKKQQLIAILDDLSEQELDFLLAQLRGLAARK